MSNPIPLMATSTAANTVRSGQKSIPIFSNDTNINSNKNALGLFSNCEQDVDERSTIISSVITTNTTSILVNKQETQDVDERTILPIINNKPVDLATNTSNNKNAIKQELIVKIMNSIADENGGVFSQLPKQTLTELLVKLINSNDNSPSDGIDLVINLLTSMLNNSNSNINKNSFDFNNNDGDNKSKSILNDSSSNLQIDMRNNNNNNKKKINGAYSDYDDDEDDDYDLIIEGTVNDMPYKLIDLDVEPSKLWSDPPELPNDSPMSNTADQESDPRIKYYLNISNSMNLTNFQLQMQQQNQLQQLQQQQQMTPTSPSSNSPSLNIQTVINTNLNNNLLTAVSSIASASASSPSGGQTESINIKQQTNNNNNNNNKTNRIADPRLLRNQNLNNNNNNNINNLSPTRSVSPPNHEQNRQLVGNSLLSSLPDFQFPKDSQLQKNTSLNNLMQQQQNESNTVKLSIEDYKRKLQKPSNTNNNNNNGNNRQTFFSSISSNTSSLLSANSNDSVQQQQQQQSVSSNSTNTSNTPTLPSIPSYLQAPQSLHELLKNFQS